MRALPLLLLILVGWPTWALATTGLSGCKEDNTICREDCSVEHGSSSRTYSKLNVCLGKCRDKYNLCRERHLALQEEETLGIERNPNSVPTVPRDPTRFTETQDEPPEPKAPAASTTSESPARRGVYRASEPEPEPAPKPQASAKPEPEEDELAEETPAPTPASPPKSTAAEPTVRRDVFRAAEPEPEPAKAPEPPKAAAAKPEPAKPVAASQPDPLIDDEEEPPPPPPKPKPPPPTRPALPPEPKKDISDWDPNGD